MERVVTESEWESSTYIAASIVCLTHVASVWLHQRQEAPRFDTESTIELSPSDLLG